MRVHGPWVIETTINKYQSEFVDLREDQVKRPDGSPGTYATVTLKPGVAVLPLSADGHVYLTRQFRYALGRESVEVPSGTVEQGEEPLAAAKREIHEELGIEAHEWHHIGVVDVDTSIVRCAVDLFLARDLRFAEREQDSTEVIQPISVSLDAAVTMVINSQITHTPSCVVILMVERRLRAAPSSS
jgi:8-oxo-dGTP pyrophosphatase MutT (NUDIX family)